MSGYENESERDESGNPPFGGVNEMLLAVIVPDADAAFRGGYIALWHIGEGEEVGFGADLCDIAVDDFVALQRTKRATLLGSTSKLRRRRIRDKVDRRTGRGQVVIRLVSSESGLSLRKIIVPKPGRIEFGSVVALLGTSESAIPEEFDSLPEARVSTDFPDPEEFDPF